LKTGIREELGKFQIVVVKFTNYLHVVVVVVVEKRMNLVIMRIWMIKRRKILAIFLNAFFDVSKTKIVIKT
jgi:hypothetical protein